MFHKIILVGNLGRDPETRYTPAGHPVTTFSVASNRRYTGSDGQPVEEVLWFQIHAWGKLAEVHLWCGRIEKTARNFWDARIIPNAGRRMLFPNRSGWN
jgi:single-strand DNA-binding protein